MKFSPLASLKEGDLQIDQKKPVTGASLLTAFKNLFTQLNPYFDSINKLAAKGVGLADNVQCEVVTGAFTHGVPQLVSLKTLARANGAIVLGCDGQLPAVPPSISMVQGLVAANGNPLCTVTLWFNDSTAVNVNCALVLFPEGQQSSSAPVFLGAIPKSLLTTTGDIIYAGAPNTPARLPIGTADSYLRSPDGTSAAAWFTNPALGATSAAAQSIPNGTTSIVVFGTVERDSDTAYNSVSGRFTVPANKGGDYEVISSFSYAAAQTGAVFAFIYKNGSEVKRYQVVNPTAGLSLNISAILFACAAGDIIDIRTAQPAGTAQSLAGTALMTYLAIKRLS